MPMKYRSPLLESRLNNVEIRLNFGLEDLSSLKSSVQILNETLFTVDDTACQVNDRNKSGHQKVLAVKDAEEPIREFKEKVLRALMEEKSWMRKEIKSLQNHADRLEMDFGDLQKDVKDILNNCTIKVEALESRLETRVTHEVDNLHTMLTHAIDDSDIKIKVTQSTTKQNQDAYEAMKEDIVNIYTQFSQFSKSLGDFEDKVTLKLFTELDDRMACPPKWNQFIGYCYTLHTDAVDFDTAVDICSKETSYLADIQSDDENEYLHKLSGRRIWIGISDRTEEGKWVSVRNGKPLEYSNWETNQPQNFAAYDEDCAAMSGSERRKWHDYKCTHKFSFVCKKMVDTWTKKN